MGFGRREEAERTAGQPRFCPGCGLKEPGEGELCPECGARVLEQGYCPVCEGYWPAPAGAECPKHEIALEAGPAQGSWLDDGEELHWVTVATYSHPSQADAARIRLEAEGVPTFLEGERMGTNTIYQGATGGVKLQVPEPLVADARVLLAQSWAPVAEEEDDDLDDAWEELGPEPGAAIESVALGFVLIPLVLIALLSLGGLVVIALLSGGRGQTVAILAIFATVIGFVSWTAKSSG